MGALRRQQSSGLGVQLEAARKLQRRQHGRYCRQHGGHCRQPAALRAHAALRASRSQQQLPNSKLLAYGGPRAALHRMFSKLIHKTKLPCSPTAVHVPLCIAYSAK